MNQAYDSIQAAVGSLRKIRQLVKRKSTAQVRSQDEIDLIESSSLAWFKRYRDAVVGADPDLMCAVDDMYREILHATQRHTTRKSYDALFKSTLTLLVQLQDSVITVGTTLPSGMTDDTLPEFDKLIQDEKMKNIMIRRWCECKKCISTEAPLAATVMMGGLLEALFLAKLNSLDDKKEVFSCDAAPINKRTNKPLELKEWTLKNYIAAGHELGWISVSAKDVSVVLRDYRNFIHPYKEHSHNVVLCNDDALLFWEIVKSIARQLLS